MPMARAIWSGSISFGLLNVPVKLYSAVARRGILLRGSASPTAPASATAGSPKGPTRRSPTRRSSRPSRSPQATTCRSRKDERKRWRRRTGAIEVLDFVDLEPDRPDLLRQPLLPRPRQGRRESVFAARRALEKSGRSPSPASSSATRSTWRRSAPRRGAHPDHDALRRRGRAGPASSTTCCPRRAEGRRKRGRDGGAADRLADPRVRPDRLPGRVPRGTDVADRRKAEGKEIVTPEPRSAEATRPRT